jgi:hypothetical protein
MERETLSNALATLCSWFLIPCLAIFLLYVFFRHTDGLLWVVLPILAIIYFIKNQAEKKR